MNIEEIPIEELEKDRIESLEDIKLCEVSLRLGVKETQSGINVEKRLSTNKKIVEKIDKELLWRKPNG